MARFLNLFSGKSKAHEGEKVITIVSGLPRSGTSMMMKMLEAGGLEVFTDNIRTADDDNPKGYYEFERVKKLDKGDTVWVEDAQGKVVKVISVLLQHLPPGYTYRVIFMHRQIAEVLASQRKMLIRRGEPTDKVSDERLAQLYRKHLRQVEDWLAQQSNFSVLYVTYNDVLKDPLPHVRRINQFLGGRLDEEQMVTIVDPTLYRQRQEQLSSTAS